MDTVQFFARWRTSEGEVLDYVLDLSARHRKRSAAATGAFRNAESRSALAVAGTSVAPQAVYSDALLEGFRGALNLKIEVALGEMWLDNLSRCNTVSDLVGPDLAFQDLATRRCTVRLRLLLESNKKYASSVNIIERRMHRYSIVTSRPNTMPYSGAIARTDDDTRRSLSRRDLSLATSLWHNLLERTGSCYLQMASHGRFTSVSGML